MPFDFVITSVSFQPATSDKSGSKPVIAHSVVCGKFPDDSEFACRFSELHGAYLEGERVRNKRLPEPTELAQALREYYREVQNAQVANLVSQNRANDLRRIREQQAITGKTPLPEHNHEEADPSVMQLEAEILAEAKRAEELGIEGDAPVPPGPRKTRR